MFLVEWPGGSWEATLQYVLLILGTYAAALWITLIYWTFRDIRQRTRDGILQAFSVILVTALFLPGLWIYLILRPRHTLTELYERSLEEEALLQELEDQKACPTCRRRVKDDYLVCPSCRTQLKELCRSCSKPLSYAWNACPFCGLEKTPRAAIGPRQRPEARMPVTSISQRTGPVPTTTGPPAPSQAPSQANGAQVRSAGPDPFTRRPAASAAEEGAVIDLTADGS
jgi:hypothetical protein